MKLTVGQGGIAQRLVLEEYDVSAIPPFKTLLNFLISTHIYVATAAIAAILLHLAMVGLPACRHFICPSRPGPGVVARCVWVFLPWRFSPQELKKVSYVVHAQFVTGIMIGIFSGVGHPLLDD
ncbi:hypothetical protein PJI16_18985 [Nitrospira sp. MA-1]|nr:hypothetical protein [Nitrospira sp. MA-1]